MAVRENELTLEYVTNPKYGYALPYVTKGSREICKLAAQQKVET